MASLIQFDATRRQRGPYAGRAVRYLLAVALSAASLTCSVADAGAALQLQTPADTPNVSASVDREQVTIAEPFQLLVEVTAPSGVPVRFPATPERLGNFDVTEVADSFDIPVAAGRQWTRVYTLECLDAGPATVPPLEIGVGSRLVTTRPIPVDVRGVVEATADPTSFRDWKPPAALLPPDPPPAGKGWLIGLAGIATLSLGLLLWLRRKPAELAPVAWGRQALQRTGQRWEQGQLTEVDAWSELAMILKSVCGRQYQLAVTGRTSDEWLDELEQGGQIPVEWSSWLRALLRRTDGMKFARREGNAQLLAAELEQAYRFLDVAELPRAENHEPLEASAKREVARVS